MQCIICYDTDNFESPEQASEILYKMPYISSDAKKQRECDHHVISILTLASDTESWIYPPTSSVRWLGSSFGRYIHDVTPFSCIFIV